MSVTHEFTASRSTQHPSEMELTITIVGAQDIYRFSHHMLTGQVEFGQRGLKIIEALKRRMGASRFNHLDRSMGGWRMRGVREPREQKRD